MDNIHDSLRVDALADCPYCGGEGTDPKAPLGRCGNCYGTGRTARFLAERTLARWARYRRSPVSWRSERDRIEDEVLPRQEP